MGAAIAVEDLAKRFGAVEALRGVSFDVRAGTVFGLLGPNGAGKTTAIRVLATILRPDAGRATVLGLDVAREPGRVRARIGLAGQYAAVDANLTGRENLRMIGRLTHVGGVAARGAELLERFGLTDAADRPVRTYSGGMRRRLDLAASLVHRPEVLFLDEPTTGLDPHSRRELWDMVRELVADGTTVLLTTQYMEEADRLASRVGVIDRGELLALDTPSALKSRLGGTVIELGWEEEEEAVRAERALAGVTQFERDASTVRVTASGGAHTLVQILGSLERAGAAPRSLSVREPSLDDVFLSLTGRHAEGGEAP